MIHAEFLTRLKAATARACPVPAETPPRPSNGPQPERKPPPDRRPRISLLNMRGTRAQVEWLERVHRQTHLSKSNVLRLGLAMWARETGIEPFPMPDDGQ